jgi:predicted RNase H-like HicB family nuclease
MPKKRSYDYVTWEADGMWASHAPSVPGVYGLGDTAREAEADLAEAMATMSQYLAEVGEALPSPRSVRTGHLRA